MLCHASVALAVGCGEFRKPWNNIPQQIWPHSVIRTLMMFSFTFTLGQLTYCVALCYWPEGEKDGRAASGGALAPEPPRTTGAGPHFHGFCHFPVCGIGAGLFPPFFFSVVEIGHLFALKLDNFTSHFSDFFEIGHPIFSFSPHFFWNQTKFSASPGRREPKYCVFKLIFPPNLRSDNEWSPISKKKKTQGKKDPRPKLPPGKGQNPRDSGPTPVARGGSGAKAPPLATRPKRGLQLPWDLLKNSPLLLCR